MKSFVTGSRKYGTATAESDVDLVVLVNLEDLAILRGMADPSKSPTYEGVSGNLRFGKLNLICLTTDIDFAAWRTASAVVEGDIKHAKVEDSKSRYHTKGLVVDCFLGFQNAAKRAIRQLAGYNLWIKKAEKKEAEERAEMTESGLKEKLASAVADVVLMLQESGDERTAVCLEKSLNLALEKACSPKSKQEAS